MLCAEHTRNAPSLFLGCDHGCISSKTCCPAATAAQLQTCGWPSISCFSHVVGAIGQVDQGPLQLCDYRVTLKEAAWADRGQPGAEEKHKCMLDWLQTV